VLTLEHLVQRPRDPPRGRPPLLVLLHGQADPVIPLSRGIAARDLFVELGVALGYREYATGHQLTAEMQQEAADFLTVQLNRALPRGAAG
jgi:predicted esterase